MWRLSTSAGKISGCQRIVSVRPCGTWTVHTAVASGEESVDRSVNKVQDAYARDDGGAHSDDQCDTGIPGPSSQQKNDRSSEMGSGSSLPNWPANYFHAIVRYGRLGSPVIITTA